MQYVWDVATALSADFEQSTEPYRRELLAHCYRMLGSVQDAEDLLQETLVRAWRASERFDERRASLRTWLYRIATNACLTALQGRSRRPLPSGLVAASNDPNQPFVPGAEVAWLQPFPDTLLGDPAAVTAARGSLRLALVAAMQHLPPRQRAVLILRDVLDWPAADVADALQTTTAAVNSALQRARATLGEAALVEEAVDESAHRAVVDRYVAAFESADVAALSRIVTADALLEMPPMLNWYVGREAYAAFLARVFAMRGTDWRMVPVGANGQPAVAAYARGGDGVYQRHTLQVFDVSAGLVARNTVFADPAVFDLFDVPRSL